MKRRAPAPDEPEFRNELSAPAAHAELSPTAAAIAGGQLPPGHAAQITEDHSELADRVRNMTKRDPAVAANVVRMWLGKQIMMPPSTEPVSGAAKAAMFLMGLGDPLSAELLRQFEPDEILRITTEISALEAVSPREMVSVFREFESLSGSGRFFAKGGADFARRLVEQALGADSAVKLLNAPPPKPTEEDPEMRLLQSTDPQQLATFLRDENPQTIALVLSNMSPTAAGALMQSLPPDLVSPIALRMVSLESVSPEVSHKITEALGTKLKAVRQVSRPDGLRSLANLLNHMDPALSGRISPTWNARTSPPPSPSVTSCSRSRTSSTSTRRAPRLCSPRPIARS